MMAYHRSLTSQNMARSGLLSRNLSALGPLWPPWVLISSRILLQYEKASRVLSQRQGYESLGSASRRAVPTGGDTCKRTASAELCARDGPRSAPGSRSLPREACHGSSKPPGSITA